MTFVSKPAALSLAYRAVLSLRGRAGDCIDCLDGSVWITQDGDSRDVVLAAGERFTLDRAGRALVYALAPACVGFAPRIRPASFAATARAMWRRRFFFIPGIPGLRP